MAKDTRSFFERLTGAEPVEEEEVDDIPADSERRERIFHEHEEETAVVDPEDEEEGELSIDMYETRNDIVIKTVVAGVRPDELEISITRERVSIRGTRNPEHGFDEADYHYQEIYWGAFARTVDLPEEIEVDESEAVAKHGLLVLKLPKLNKNRETKLKVKIN